MVWVFLSPHLDDVALSCGGMVWEQAQRGEEVHIWTICAGDPPAGGLSDFARSLHERWQTPAEAVSQRRLEDQASCQALGAKYRHFSIPDCIYRPGGKTGCYYYTSEESLFGELHPAEQPLVEELVQELARLLPDEAQVVCPLALGGHVDHRLTRVALEKINCARWYYADYPYAIQEAEALNSLLAKGWINQVFRVSEAGLHAWQAAVAAHSSQISTFWADLDAMKEAIQTYWQEAGGVRLWKPV